MLVVIATVDSRSSAVEALGRGMKVFVLVAIVDGATLELISIACVPLAGALIDIGAACPDFLGELALTHPVRPFIVYCRHLVRLLIRWELER
jgi:hypothetical protein